MTWLEVAKKKCEAANVLSINDIGWFAKEIIATDAPRAYALLERARGMLLDYWSICRDNGWKDQRDYARELLDDLERQDGARDDKHGA